MIIKKNMGTKIKEVLPSSQLFHLQFTKTKHLHDYPHKLTTQKMFKDKVFDAKLKKDKATINMVLVIATRSQDPGLVFLWEKEP